MNHQFNLTDVWLRSNFPDLSGILPLNKGGQKLVFSATHPANGDVVLKIVQPSQNVEDVRREILAVLQVQSSRVPIIYDHGAVTTPLGTCYWLREQRIYGSTIRELLKTQTLNPRETLKLGLHLLEALVKAEEAKIVHRDVKPDNIIHDLAGNYWLLDFGIARHLTLDSLTATALPFGKVTWGYSPPEQCRNLKPSIDGRADLFALGITLYECSTGNNPFRVNAANALEIFRRVETVPLPPLALPITRSDQFRDLVAAMTQKRRDHRPLTIRQALTWIEEICAAEGL